jgi:hypothetical protein
VGFVPGGAIAKKHLSPYRGHCRIG